MQKELVIGIDLGVTKIRGAVVDKKGNLLEWKVFPSAANIGNKTILLQIRSIIDEFRLIYKNISGIGIGTPGIVDKKLVPSEEQHPI